MSKDKIINLNQTEMSREEALNILSMTIEEIEVQANNPQSPEYPNLGKYGLLAREYLKEEHPSRYQLHMMEGDLMTVLLQVEQEAEKMMNTLMEQLRKRTPRPQTEDYLTLVQYETRIKDTAEETVLSEIVYQIR